MREEIYEVTQIPTSLATGDELTLYVNSIVQNPTPVDQVVVKRAGSPQCTFPPGTGAEAVSQETAEVCVSQSQFDVMSNANSANPDLEVRYISYGSGSIEPLAGFIVYSS